MSKKKEQNLLEVISRDQLSLEQQHRWSDVKVVHKLLREPNDISEFQQCEGMVAILLDNKTVSFIYPRSERNVRFPDDPKSMKLTFLDDDICLLSCVITGPTDGVMAETAAFFWSIHHSEANKPFLAIHSSSHYSDFDFRAVQQEQLARMFEANPTRNVAFSHLTISAEQSVILATRKLPVYLRFDCFCAIEDNGDALVSALQNRQSPIGSLIFSAVNCSDDKVWLSNRNVQRMLQISYIDKLVLDGCFSDDLIPFLFSSPIETIHLDDCHDRITQRVQIAPGVLSLELSLSWGSVYPAHSMFSYLSHLDHRFVTKLTVFVSSYDKALDNDIKELIRFICARPNLEVLRWDIPIESAEILKELFAVAEQHKGLRTLQIMKFPYALDRRHQCLAKLIQRNRVVQVTDNNGDLVANGNDMYLTYSLNRFYCGLPNLGQESRVIRSALVRETLIQSANRDFQRCALLLAKQTDSLCEFVRAISDDMLVSNPATDGEADRTIQAAVPDLPLPEVSNNESKRESKCCCEQSCKRVKM